MFDIDTFSNICNEAHNAGMAAVEKLQVIPMVVGQETSLFSNQIDYSKPTYYVEDGVCGFAWVNVKPKNKGNTRLGKQERAVLESQDFSKSSYEKTYQLWISKFNQSMQKKEAYAYAFAKVLRDYGFDAYAGSRMD